MVQGTYQAAFSSTVTAPNVQDVGANDTTTQHSQPAASQSGVQQDITFFLQYSALTWIDNAKFIMWYTDAVTFAIEYSVDGSAWTAFTGGLGASTPHLGTYSNEPVKTVTTTRVQVKYVRLSIRDTGASCRVGSSDFRAFDGVAEQVPA